MIDRFVEKYSEVVVERPLLVFGVALLLTLVLASGATKVQTVEQSTSDFLPETFESIQAFDVLEKEFSSTGGTTYTILLVTDPDYPDSTEIRDMRSPRALRYMRTIDADLSGLRGVDSVDSPADLFREIPPAKKGVKRAMDRLGESRWSRYISRDYSAARIEVQAGGLSAREENRLADRIRYVIESQASPAGIEYSLTGQPFIDQAFQEQAQQTSRVTSIVAFSLVLVIVIGLFRSFFFGFASLQTLVFGIAAGFGTFGLLGFNLSPATSGAISIGVGIAIDFGIQPVSRYREERRDLGMEEALSTTIKGVARPMTLGVIAAVMGFLTLSLGRITFLSSLGIMLSLTTSLAYVAAFTVIPSTLIIHDRYVTPAVKKILEVKTV